MAFEEEKAVILASRSGATVMEVWSFSPPEDDVDDSFFLEPRSPSAAARDRDDDQLMLDL